MSKYRVLAWGDAATAGTGFGTVSKNVLMSLHNTGRYEIEQLAINFHGDFVDKNEIPWQMQPARLLNPKDPHGIKMFHRTLMKRDYDIVWILNDIFVTHEAREIVNNVRDHYRSRNKKPPVFIHYYPVDCHVSQWASGMLDACDVAVCYTDHGETETLLTCPHLSRKIRKIPHGVDTQNFKPESLDDIARWKHKVFSVSPDTTVVINVNRNSTRKQIPYSILAFKEFKKQVPNSILYLHMMVQDQGGDLARAVQDAGLSLKKDVLLPHKFSTANPAPLAVMNQLFNCGDIFLTTHLGEGWGLTITEAMAAGVPVVAPNNTCMPQQLGDNSERGYLYECRDMTWIDNSGYRPKGLLPDIVDKMMEVYNDGAKQDNPKVHAALEFAKDHDWKLVGEQWVQLFDEAVAVKDKSNLVITEVI